MTKDDLKYTLDRLYRCRDLEINNLWQRSVFLSVFLILCFTGYGYLIFKILETISSDNESSNEGFINYHLISLVLSSIGIIFSIIWILMAKASKAWYEVYEGAIYNFEREYIEELEIPEKYIMGNMNTSVDTKIYSTNGGAYSPSRINIAIGIISLLVWGIIMLIHFFVSLWEVFNSSCINKTIFLQTIIAIAIPLTTLSICLYILLSDFIKSGFLGK